MKEKRKWFLALFLMLATLTWAQGTITVSGQVTDQQNEPLIGVTVLIDGQQTGGTVTDFDGNYTIKAPAKATLKFSYIGYQDQKIAVGGKNMINVQMKEDAELLQEVVVVGYGTQKKESLTGAVSVVGEKMLKDKGVISNPAQALQGQVPGVIITRTSAAPGDESWNMKLRGSFSKNNSNPLIIIDGVESESFGELNPNDIESINFLKDASAAIYGSKAAGGVVLVQTKKSKGGKVKVEYSGTLTAKFVGLQPTLMTLDEWCDAAEMARLNDGYTLADDMWLQYVAVARANKGKYINLKNSLDPMKGKFVGVDYDYVFFDTDWLDILWGTALSTSHELSVSGGSEKSTYRISARYMYDGSTLQWGENNNRRYNLRLSNNFHLTDRIDLESVIAFTRTDQVKPTQLNNALNTSFPQPGFPSSTTDGKPYAWGTWGAPNWYLEKGGENKLRSNTINISETLKYRISNDFDAVATAGYNVSNAIRDIQSNSIEWYNYAGDTQFYTNPTQEQTYYAKTSARTDLYTINAYLNWHHDFGRHHVAAMAGTQYNLKEYDRTVAKAYNILQSLEVINGNGEVKLLDDENNGPQRYHESLLSYFSRLNYDFDGKYLLEGNFRYDGSSKFQPENRWAFFGGVSAGWRISEEKFMKDFGIFDNLKLRLSYGTVGNQAGIDRYDGIQLYNFYQSKGALVDGALLSYIDTNGKILSTDRTWETIKNYNIGLDFGVLKNRLTGTIEFFWKKCDNMLIAVNYPSILGDNAPTGNYGKFKAHGYEGNINWQDKIGELTYHMGGTLTYATNELVDNGGDASIKAGVVSNREGYPLNSVFGLRYCGKIQNQDQLDKYMAKYGGDNNNISMPSRLRLGDNMYEDVNNDGKLTEADLVYLGSDDPKLQYSFNFGLEWKGFDLSVVFQGAGYRTIWRAGNSSNSNANWRIPMRSVYVNSTNQSVGNVWSPETPNAYYPTYTNNKTINDYNYYCSSWSVEDGSYLRLKTLTLGYNFPKKLLAATRIISACRMYVSGSDLWEKSNINDGWDPEASRTVTTTGRYPFTRNVTFGMSVTF